MSTKRILFTVLAASTVVLALVFGSQLADSAHALPSTQSPALSAVPQAESGSASETALSHSHLTPAVVYVTGDGHIHEIALKGTWQHRDLTAAAGAPLTYSYDTRAMAFRRSDGVSMVVYRGTDNHIHSLYLELVHQGNSWQEVWHWADLSAITGSPAAASDPYGYVRSDGTPISLE